MNPIAQPANQPARRGRSQLSALDARLAVQPLTPAQARHVQPARGRGAARRGGLGSVRSAARAQLAPCRSRLF